MIIYRGNFTPKVCLHTYNFDARSTWYQGVIQAMGEVMVNQKRGLKPAWVAV